MYVKRWEFDFVMVLECSAGNQAVLDKTVSSLLCYILHRLNGFTMLKPATTIVSACAHKWVDNFRNSAHQQNPIAVNTEPQHAMESFLYVWLCPKSG